MLEVLTFEDSLQENVINKVSPTMRFLTSLTFLTAIFLENQILPLLLLYALIINLVGISQGYLSVIRIYWGLKNYLLLVIFVIFLFQGFKMNLFVWTAFVKLLAIFIAFALFTKTTSPENLIDVLIQLRIPTSIAWSVGVAFRQAILLLEDVYYIQAIQRSRRGYHSLSIPSKLRFRIEEVYSMLFSILSRSVIISSEFAIALKMRGWQGAHKDIILNHAPNATKDYFFLFIIISLTFTITLTV